jgi:tRNA nucleotidyltransferase (CCA-adding enzyme)
LHEDARRRDFTCNAIYYNPETGEYIDPTGGREDIENGIIRFVGDIHERILEDALRILRCIRFKNRYDFKFADENYWNILKENITILKSISIERIRQELDNILLHESNTLALDDLKRINFLELFIPELHILDRYP